MRLRLRALMATFDGKVRLGLLVPRTPRVNVFGVDWFIRVQGLGVRM